MNKNDFTITSPMGKSVLCDIDENTENGSVSRLLY